MNYDLSFRLEETQMILFLQIISYFDSESKVGILSAYLADIFVIISVTC